VAVTWHEVYKPLHGPVAWIPTRTGRGHDLEYRPRVRVLMSVFLSDTCVIPDPAISPSMNLVAGNVNLALVKQA
jgi:hypothetical protein